MEALFWQFIGRYNLFLECDIIINVMAMYTCQAVMG